MDDIPIQLSGEIVRLSRQKLTEWLRAQRWFGGKARAIQTLELQDTMEVSPGIIAIFRVTYADGGTELYSVPLKVHRGMPAQGAVVQILPDQALLIDALSEDAFRKSLLHLLADKPTGELRGIVDSDESRLLPATQSNTAIVYRERLFLKWFRKLSPGMNPDMEMSRYFRATGFAHTARYLGSIERSVAGTGVCTLAVGAEWVSGATDGWTWAVDDARAQKADGHFTNKVELLGACTTEMHRVLADNTKDEAFAPEPLKSEDVTALVDGVRMELDALSPLLIDYRNRFSDDTAEKATAALLTVSKWLKNLPLPQDRNYGMKIRIHGDYHLGQVLLRKDGSFVISDFEGEPSRSFAERRMKQSPLRDVAGMMRSFDYAAHSMGHTTDGTKAWSATMQERFLNGWRGALSESRLAPLQEPDFQWLLRVFLLQKLLYEIRYELQNRPDWATIPLRGLLQFAFLEV